LPRQFCETSFLYAAINQSVVTAKKAFSRALIQRFGRGIELFDGAADLVEHQPPGDDHAIERRVAFENSCILLGLENALQAVGEEDRVDGAGSLGMAVGIDIEVLRQGIGHGPGAAGGPGRGAAGAAFGVVVEAQGEVARALLFGADDVFDAA